MSDPCPFSGDLADDRHHLTGTDAAGGYLDPDLVVPTSHSDHELIHDDWHTLGLADAPDGLTLTGRLELRLRRLAVAIERFAEAQPSWTWLAGWAQTVRGWADDLAADARERDRRDPGWRDDPAFRPGDA